jgi:hypothetical protein
MAKNRRTSTLDQQIDANLRRVYSETLKQPIPDRFTQLLEELRQQQQEKSDPPSGEDE